MAGLSSRIQPASPQYIPCSADLVQIQWYSTASRPRPRYSGRIRLEIDNGTALHVFKIANGGAMGRLALGRVLGAGLNEGDELAIGGEGTRTGSLFFLQGDKTAKLGEARSGGKPP